MCCPQYTRKGTCSQPPGSRQPLPRVTVHGQRTALCHLDRTRVLLSRPSWLCGNGEHCEKVPGLDITKLVAVPPWLQKAPFGLVVSALHRKSKFLRTELSHHLVSFTKLGASPFFLGGGPYPQWLRPWSPHWLTKAPSNYVLKPRPSDHFTTSYRSHDVQGRHGPHAVYSGLPSHPH